MEAQRGSHPSFISHNTSAQRGLGSGWLSPRASRSPALCQPPMPPLLETAARPSSPSILAPAPACHSPMFFELEVLVLRCPQSQKTMAFLPGSPLLTWPASSVQGFYSTIVCERQTP